MKDTDVKPKSKGFILMNTTLNELEEIKYVFKENEGKKVLQQKGIEQ